MAAVDAGGPSGILLSASARPLPGGCLRAVVPEGLTIAQILDHAALPEALRASAVVRLGGEVVPPELWHRVRPKSGTLVEVGVVPQGGGGGRQGGKNPVAMIAMVAVMVAAVAFQQYYLLPALTEAGLTGTALAVASSVGTMAFTMVGGLLVSALIPPPSQGMSDAAGRGSSIYSIGGVGNQMRPYGVVPWVLGKHRVEPPLAAEPYTVVEGRDQYLHALYDLGPGPLRLSDMRFGDTPVGEFDAEVVVLAGEDGDDLADLDYTFDRDTVSIGREVLQDDGWVTYRLDDCHQAYLQYEWPGGVYARFKDSGNIAAIKQRLYIDWRAVGETDWTSAEHVVGTHLAKPTKTSAFRRAYNLRFPRRGDYEIRYRVKKNGGDGDKVSGGANKVDACVFSSYTRILRRAPVTVAGQHCLVSIRVKAQGSVSSTVQAFNCVAESRLLTWIAGTWGAAYSRNPAWAFLTVLKSGVEVPDDRIDFPSIRAWATHCAEDVDGEPRYTFDAVYDFRTTKAEALRQIAAAGGASLTTVDGKIGVVMDVTQDTPVQLFTPKNSWGFRGEKTFKDLPHALRARFLSEDADWQQDELYIYADGKSAANATRFETWEVFGVTRPSQVWRMGRTMLAVAELRPETWRISCDIENLRCQRGDMVAVAHDVPRIGGSWGRVKAQVLDGGGQVVGLELDEPVAMAALRSYVLRARFGDGVQQDYSLTTVAGESTTVTLASPLTPAAAPQTGDLYAVGEATRHVRDMLVTRVEPGPDLTATLTLVDAAPEVHAAADGPVPPYSSGITRSRMVRPPPAVTGLVVQEAFEVVGGVVRSVLSVVWEPSPLTGVSYEVMVRQDGGEWVQVALTTDAYAMGGPLEYGSTYTVAVVVVDASGRRRWVETSARATLRVGGKTWLPPVPDRFTVEDAAGHLRRFRWSWTGETPPDLAGVRLRYAAGVRRQWSNGLPLHDGVVAAPPFETGALRSGTWTVMAKAVDTSGLESEEMASITINLGDREVSNVIAEHDFGAAGWPGVVTGGAVVAGQIRGTDTSGLVWTESSAPMWRADADAMWSVSTAAMWPSDATPMWEGDGLPMWRSTYPAMTYVTSYKTETDGLLSLSADVDGTAQLYIRDPYPDAAWGKDEQPMWSSDAAPMWRADTTWTPWTTPRQVHGQALDIRLEFISGSVRPVVRSLTATLDVPDRVERLEDVSISAAGTRLPITKGYRAIIAVVLTLQDDGGSAVTAKVVDKSTAGPLVKCYNAAGTSVAGLIDATVQGYL